MQAIPLIQASQLQPFTTFLTQLGSPTEKLLERSHISPVLLRHPDCWMPEYQLTAFMVQAGRQEGNLLEFNLAVGLASRIEQYSPIGGWLADAVTVYEALAKFCRLANLYSSHCHFSVRFHSEGLWFCRTGVREIDIGQTATECYTVMLMINLVRSLVGFDWRPAKVYLQMQATPEVKTHELFRDIELVFEHSSTIIAVESNLLYSPLQGLGPATSQSLNSSPNSAPPPPKDFLPSLRCLLEPLVSHDYPEIKRVAQITGYSDRTLQRRLTSKGASYRSLIEQIRLDKASALLADPKVSITEISSALGYSTPTHFTRAFKRWTGLSPQQMRKHLLSA